MPLTRRSMLVASKMPMTMGNAAVAVDFLEHDDLLLVDLADDDPLQLHLDRHGSLAFGAARRIGKVGTTGLLNRCRCTLGL